MNSLLILLSLAGFAIATYFTAIAYRWVNPEASYLPGFCRMGETTCASVVFTPRARLFGLPNSVLGQVYYAALITGVATGLLWTKLYWPTVAASALTVVTGIFLTWSLLFRTRIPCRLCFTTHAINAVLFVLLILAR